jgi:hypothetical protein
MKMAKYGNISLVKSERGRISKIIVLGIFATNHCRSLRGENAKTL